MLIRASIPGYRKIKDDTDESYTVFCIEIWVSGRRQCLEKRYTEFEDLHKQVKKLMRTPEFPPKKVMKWSHKVLEHRRQALQIYLQGILDTEVHPKSLLKFLNVNIETGSFDSLDKLGPDSKATHQPVIAFPSDAFLQDNTNGTLPDIVAEGVIMGLYAPVDEILPR
ncbi:sorting nexin-24-like [Gigantopelta aegis]|uniref:sorting nexin-24-like n=1 Tax=Gigantopelta aegis TaxID=1735272 RepID=UPI001B888283|nr:sorting nexin-24-like [Gigantopelta aegis]